MVGKDQSGERKLGTVKKRQKVTSYIITQLAMAQQALAFLLAHFPPNTGCYLSRFNLPSPRSTSTFHSLCSRSFMCVLTSLLHPDVTFENYTEVNHQEKQ